MVVFQVILMIAAAVLLYIVGEKIYKFWLYFRLVNAMPNLVHTVPFIGSAVALWCQPLENHLDCMYDVSLQYEGGFFHAWLGHFSVISAHLPKHVEGLLRSSTEVTKLEGYKLLTPWLGQGLLTSSGSYWFHSRKLMNPAFSFQMLENFAEVMVEKTAIFMECIDRKIKIHGDTPFDIHEMALKCALDIICETAMGIDLRTQTDVECDYTKAVATISSLTVRRIYEPWILFNWIFDNTSMGKSYREAVKLSHEFCSNLIVKKQQARKLHSNMNGKVTKNHNSDVAERKCLLDILLEENEKDEHPMTNAEIRDQINTILFTGHDTTGALVSWTLFCVGNDSDIQRKVHEELDQVLGNSDERETLRQLPNLKYLERVIKEALRLYPSVPQILRTLQKDSEIGGYVIPAGCNICIEIYRIHRNPRVWPNPMHFDPDRFLPENIEGRHPYAYLPFSAGPRNCIGQKYAMLEAKIAVCQILRNFTVKSVENHFTIKKYNGLIIKPIEGTLVYMKRR